MKCNHWDCGYCYAPEDLLTNAKSNACVDPENCPIYQQMKPSEDIEKIKKEIEVLKHKLSLMEQVDRTKTPQERAYKDVYGYYPITDSMSGSGIQYASWEAFQKGYDAGYDSCWALFRMN